MTFPFVINTIEKNYFDAHIVFWFVIIPFAFAVEV